MLKVSVGKKIKEVSKLLLQSKDGRTVFANFSYLSLLQVAGYVFPLITMPYLARVIGAEGFGKIAFASAIVVWVQTITDWGFNMTATRDVAQNRDNKLFVSRVFSNVLWTRCFLSVMSGLLLLVAIVSIPYLRENAAIILISFLLVPGQILFPEWFFQAVERMKYTTIFNLVIKIIFTIAVFIFIRDSDDYLIQPLLTVVGYLVCGVISMYVILKKWGYTLYKPKFSEIFKTIKSSTDVFINNLMPNLYNSFSVLLLGAFWGANSNGLYDGGNKVPTIFYNFQAALSRAFFPFLSRHPERHGLYEKINIVSAVSGAVILV